MNKVEFQNEAKWKNLISPPLAPLTSNHCYSIKSEKKQPNFNFYKRSDPFQNYIEQIVGIFLSENYQLVIKKELIDQFGQKTHKNQNEKQQKGCKWGVLLIG